jgi:hypothetical protein
MEQVGMFRHSNSHLVGHIIKKIIQRRKQYEERVVVSFESVLFVFVIGDIEGRRYYGPDSEETCGKGHSDPTGSRRYYEGHG